MILENYCQWEYMLIIILLVLEFKIETVYDFCDELRNNDAGKHVAQTLSVSESKRNVGHGVSILTFWGFE